MLVVGCGDVGQRALPLLQGRARLLVLTRSPERRAELRALGATPLLGDLDQPATLARLAGLAHRVLQLAPPASEDADPRWRERDRRTAHLLAALHRRQVPKVLVYASTSGVYGDCGGDLVEETRPPKPQSARARRRLDAEDRLRRFGRAAGARVNVLRIPGIYAPDRPQGIPGERLRQQLPVLHRDEDVFTNHIHADDLARASVAALWRGRSQRVFNINDDTQLRMGDYFDLVADTLGLPRPPRASRAELAQQLSPMRLSFMAESRRMDNRRMKHELRLVLRDPTAAEGLASRHPEKPNSLKG